VNPASNPHMERIHGHGRFAHAHELILFPCFSNEPCFVRVVAGSTATGSKDQQWRGGWEVRRDRPGIISVPFAFMIDPCRVQHRRKLETYYSPFCRSEALYIYTGKLLHQSFMKFCASAFEASWIFKPVWLYGTNDFYAIFSSAFF
jgi:hypothetical protein